METKRNERRLPAGRIRRSGFTLVELVVATAVLMILALLVGSLFRQATSAWNTGRVRGEGSMVARGILGAVSRDLATAVDGTPYGIGFEASGGKLSFVCLKEADEDGRDVHFITYRVDGNSATREDSVWTGSEWSKPPKKSSLFEKRNDQNFEILNGDVFTSIGTDPVEKASDSVTWPSDAPAAVKVRIVFSETGTFSGVSVRSLGKNGKPDEEGASDGDDIVSD